MLVHPRHRIDMGPAQLLAGLFDCASGRRPSPEALERRWSPAGDALAALSVRSAFDLFLAAAQLPPGSEVLFSALTIPHMPEIARAHGLVPVPVDLEPATLAPTTEDVERAITGRTRVLVLAHLFGGRIELAPYVELARRRGLLLVEDAAQAFVGPEWTGSAGADLSFFSFGTIKTATALGGALARVRDPALLGRMRALQAAQPLQPAAAYARKLATFLGLTAVRGPAGFGALCGLADRFAWDLEALLRSATRGFSSTRPEALLQALRLRPCGPLLAMIERRLAGYSAARVRARTEAGEALFAELQGRLDVPGARQPHRTHWLFAVESDQPDRLIRTLRGGGFDASRGATSIEAVPAPPGRPPALRCEALLRRIVFVPAYPEIPEEARARLARLLVASADAKCALVAA